MDQQLDQVHLSIMKQPRKNLDFYFCQAAKQTEKYGKYHTNAQINLFLCLLLFSLFTSQKLLNPSQYFFYHLLCDRQSVYALKELFWNEV